MKLWLASYPRSGNTFFRNILHDCYSISSSTFDTQIEFRKYVDYESFDVVKTHELFELLPPHLIRLLRQDKEVYEKWLTAV